MAIIDLDHFKAVNDRYGHGAGDTLLAAFGRLLAAHCRKSDVACRYGGEEFCLLLPRTDAATAQRKVSHLLALWRQQRFEIEGDSLSGLSFSAGISGLHPCAACRRTCCCRRPTSNCSPPNSAAAAACWHWGSAKTAQ